MKVTFATFASALAFLIAGTCLDVVAQQVAWRTGFGATNEGSSQAACVYDVSRLYTSAWSVEGRRNRHMALAANGDVFVTGCVNNGIDADLLTVRYDGATGAVVWSATLAGRGHASEVSTQLAVDAAGDVLVLGAVGIDDGVPPVYSRPRLLKYRGDTGALLWSVAAGPQNKEQLQGLSLALGINGDAYALVSKYEVTRVHATRYDGATGVPVWATSLPSSTPGPNNWTSGQSIRVDPRGDAYIAGTGGDCGACLVVGRLDASTGAGVWAVSVPAGGGDTIDVALDPAGFVVAMSTMTGFDGSTRPMAGVVARLAAGDGSLSWTREIPLGRARSIVGPEDIGLYALRLDAAGNVLVAGAQEFAGAGGGIYGFASKLAAADGTVLWTTLGGYPTSIARWLALAVDANGDVATTGAENLGGMRTFKLRGSDGTIAWSARYRGSSNAGDAGLAVAFDPAGAIVVSGTSSETGVPQGKLRVTKYAASDGAPVWSATSPAAPGTERLEGNQLSSVRNGRIAMLSFSPRINDRGGRVSLHDAADGRAIWETFVPGLDPVWITDAGTRVAIDSAGDVLVAGSRDRAIVVAKLSAAAGTTLWESSFRGTSFGQVVGRNAAWALALDASDNVFVAGDSAIDPLDNAEERVLKFTRDGTLVWASESHGSFTTIGSARKLAIDASGDLIVTGVAQTARYSRTVKFDGRSGRRVWESDLASAASSALGIDALGNVIIAADVFDPVFDPAYPGGKGPIGVRVVKYGAGTGAELWRYDLKAGTSGAAIAVDPSGDLLVTAAAEGSTRWLVARLQGGSGVLRWWDEFAPAGSSASPRAITIDLRGNVIVVGKSSPEAPFSEARIAKWDGAIGQRLWSLPLTEAGQSGEASAVTVDAQAIYVGGSVAGSDRPDRTFLTKIVGGPEIGNRPPELDSDGDGVPDMVEAAEGLVDRVKDNDVFGNARLFAMQQYRDFLGREGDAMGIAFFQDRLADGRLTRSQVVDSFLNSPEFQSVLPVGRLYYAFFNRIPDYAGLLFQVGVLRSGVPLDAIAQNFSESPEFRNRFGMLSDGSYVDWVYRNVLGRTPEAGGVDYYVQRLGDGRMTRGQVMLGFSESPEFRNLVGDEVYVISLYAGLLRRVPEASGLAYNVNRIDQGVPRSAIIDAFLAAPEYRARFLP